MRTQRPTGTGWLRPDSTIAGYTASAVAVTMDDKNLNTPGFYEKHLKNKQTCPKKRQTGKGR
jgi:hypothetical protein